MRACDVALPVRTHRYERRCLETRGNEDESLPKNRARDVREAVAVADAPDLLAGQRFVCRGSIRADGHELILLANSDDERRGIGLVRWPAPRCLPSCLAGCRIERNNVCIAAVAIAVDDQQIAIERRRATVAMLRLISQMRRPENLARGAERSGAFGAEMHVDAVAIDDRRWRRPAVLRVDVSGLVEMKDLDVDDLTPGRDVERQRAQRCRHAAAPFFRLDDSREPDATVGDGRRRPSQTRNWRLPDDVLGFTPLERQTALGGMSLTGGAAELGPVLRLKQGRCPGIQEEDQQSLHYPF